MTFWNMHGPVYHSNLWDAPRDFWETYFYCKYGAES